MMAAVRVVMMGAALVTTREAAREAMRVAVRVTTTADVKGMMMGAVTAMTRVAA